ncbi:hypothetical protein AJ78_00483 [Emergomyces pasteurianus Ep9510]|uniref:SWR1-complex protein 5 n=1 Tax=Emergomyces pasteurianus Ep9510 TaxID=1447872 RepID=A0A1J9PUR2_9EURO|nr:hypothetical protein AJ78_00483 [Emergomyces pasteurianus Ep9510]
MTPSALSTNAHGDVTKETLSEPENMAPTLATRHDGEEEEEEEEEYYNSEEDSDFDVNAPVDDDEEDEEDEKDNQSVDVDRDRPRKRRKISPDAADGDVIVDAAFDSGDEVTIRIGKEKMDKARRKREGGKQGKGKNAKTKKKTTDDDDADDGDDFEIEDDDVGGGEGGFVRTRGMRMRMQEEQRPLAKADGATVDVDALWEKMKAAGPSPTPPNPSAPSPREDSQKDRETINDISHDTAQVYPDEETITIKRVYKFAGEVITEEKTVPKDSAEAKLYLSSEATKMKTKKASSDAKEGDRAVDSSAVAQLPLRRPLRRYSRFDPNPPDMIKKSWEKKLAAPSGIGASELPKGPKLNTVMKSKLDWAEYVDRAGIKDDLDVHSKAKEGYLGRMDFLNRVDAKKEEERRIARLKNL